jgi:hypothetical protein
LTDTNCPTVGHEGVFESVLESATTTDAGGGESLDKESVASVSPSTDNGANQNGSSNGLSKLTEEESATVANLVRVGIDQDIAVNAVVTATVNGASNLGAYAGKVARTKRAERREEEREAAEYERQERERRESYRCRHDKATENGEECEACEVGMMRVNREIVHDDPRVIEVLGCPHGFETKWGDTCERCEAMCEHGVDLGNDFCSKCDAGVGGF